jgi:hypothetical protein
MGVTISNIGDGGMQVLPTIFELVQREDYTSPDGKVTKKGELSGISAMITISHPGCQGLGGSAKMQASLKVLEGLMQTSTCARSRVASLDNSPNKKSPPHSQLTSAACMDPLCCNRNDNSPESFGKPMFIKGGSDGTGVFHVPVGSSAAIAHFVAHVSEWAQGLSAKLDWSAWPSDNVLSLR